MAGWLRQGRRQPSGKSSDGRAREPTQDMVSEVGSAAPAAGTTQPPPLDLLTSHQSHLSIDEKAFKEVQVEQERSSE